MAPFSKKHSMLLYLHLNPFAHITPVDVELNIFSLECVHCGTSLTPAASEFDLVLFPVKK